MECDSLFLNPPIIFRGDIQTGRRRSRRLGNNLEPDALRKCTLRVVTEQVRSPARAQPRSWTVVHRKAAVVVAPMTADGKLVLIRQERIPIRAALWEAPAGQVDEESDGGVPETEAVALRELREETGYQLSAAGKLVPLGYFFSSAGFTDERAYLFLARTVEPDARWSRAH